MCSATPKTFFWYFKPIALTCKAMGIFPLQNIYSSTDPKYLTIRRLSFAQLYSFCIFAGTVYMIYYFAGFFFFSEKGSIYLFLVVYVMVGRSAICFFFCSWQSKKLPKLVRLLDQFDRKKTPLLVDNNWSTFRCALAWTVLPLFVGFLTFGLTFLESGGVVKETIPPEVNEMNSKIAANFFGCLSIWQVVPLLMYTYFALRINSNFTIINKTLRRRKYCGSFFDDQIKYPDDMHLSLEYLRHMHNMMTKAVGELGKVYGNFLAIDQFCVIIMIIANICTFISQRDHDIHLICLTLLNGVVVSAVLLISEEVKKEGTKVVDLLHGVVFSKVSERCRTEIQTFLIQINVCPPEVSAAGFFIIDKRQIPSVLSAIATYLIVAIQFLDEEKLEKMVSHNSTEDFPVI